MDNTAVDYFYYLCLTLRIQAIVFLKLIFCYLTFKYKESSFGTPLRTIWINNLERCDEIFYEINIIFFIEKCAIDNCESN